MSPFDTIGIYIYHLHVLDTTCWIHLVSETIGRNLHGKERPFHGRAERYVV